MRVTFLGTSSAVPTKRRNVTSIAVAFDGEYALLDIGEGTQRQIMHAGLGFGRLKRIFITHLHGDHFFGLFPLLQTLSILRRTAPLEVYSPKGLSNILDALSEFSHFRVTFPIKVVEFSGPSVFKFSKYTVEFFPVDHLDTPTFGVKIKERDKPGRLDVEKAENLGIPPPLRSLLKKGIPIKLPDGRIVQPGEVIGPPTPGKVLVYSSDTRPTAEVVSRASGADLLIHDATFRDDLSERARATGHSTVGEACRVAIEARVKMLALVHFSARYRDEDLDEIEREARSIFPNVVVARDFLTIDI